MVATEHAAREAFGYPSTLYSRERLPEILGSTAYFGALRFGGTFGIHGHDACAGLRQGLLERGALIFERSPVTRILEHGVETPAGSVRAAAVAVCADRFLPALGLAGREIYHVKTFLAVSELLGSSDIERIFPRGPLMVWGTDITYKYFRLTGDGRLLIGGASLANMYSRTEKLRPAQVVRLLTRYLAQRFPDLRIQFAACWPDPHWRSSVVAGVSTGNPASSQALRPMLNACSPNCCTQPATTSSTSTASIPARSISSV